MITNRKKKVVDVSENSLKELMQETYNEIVDERNRALTAYKKYTKNINENTDIALVGKIGNDLLKIVDGAIEKKIRLIKIQSDILYKNGKSSNSNDDIGNIVITEDDRKWAENFLKTENKGVDEKEYE